MTGIYARAKTRQSSHTNVFHINFFLCADFRTNFTDLECFGLTCRRMRRIMRAHMYSKHTNTHAKQFGRLEGGWGGGRSMMPIYLSDIS